MRSRVVVTNRCPTGLNRGFGGPQLYLALERTMAIAARRLGLDPAELARRNLVPASALPVPRRGRRRPRLRRLRRLPRRRARAAGYAELRERQARRARRAGSWGSASPASVEPSVSNMGYITLAQTAESGAEALPKSGNAEGVAISIAPHGGVSVRLTTTPQGQGHRTVAAQVAADALGVDPGGDRRACTAPTRPTNPWTVSSGNYSSPLRRRWVPARSTSPRRSSADRLRAIAAPVLECARRRGRARRGRRARARRPGAAVSLRRLAGRRALGPARAAGRRRARARADGDLRACPSSPPDADDRCNTSATLRLHRRRRAWSRSTRETGQVAVRRLRRRCTTPGRILNPAAGRRADAAAGSPTASAPRCSRSTATTTTATS